MRCTTTQCHSTCRPSSYTHARYSHPQRSNPPHNHMYKSPRPPNNYVMHEQAPPEPHTLNMSTQRRCTSHPQQNTSEHCPLHSSRTQKNNHSNKRHPHTMTPTHPPEPPDRHIHYTPTLSHSTNRPHHYTHARTNHRKRSSPHRTPLCTATPTRRSSVIRDSAGVVPCTGSTPGRCQTTTHQSRHKCGLWSLQFDSAPVHRSNCALNTSGYQASANEMHTNTRTSKSFHPWYRFVGQHHREAAQSRGHTQTPCPTTPRFVHCTSSAGYQQRGTTRRRTRSHKCRWHKLHLRAAVQPGWNTQSTLGLCQRTCITRRLAPPPNPPQRIDVRAVHIVAFSDHVAGRVVVPVLTGVHAKLRIRRAVDARIVMAARQRRLRARCARCCNIGPRSGASASSRRRGGVLQVESGHAGDGRPSVHTCVTMETHTRTRCRSRSGTQLETGMTTSH